MYKEFELLISEIEKRYGDGFKMTAEQLVELLDELELEIVEAVE